MKFDIGDVINYRFDDGESIGIIGEFDEDEFEYKFFTKEGESYSFNITNQDDMKRIVFLCENVFS